VVDRRRRCRGGERRGRPSSAAGLPKIFAGVREEIGAGGLLHAYLDRPGGERRGDPGRRPTEERWRRRVGLQERVALPRDRGGGGV
jgi:hypothetical protein